MSSATASRPLRHQELVHTHRYLHDNFEQEECEFVAQLDEIHDSLLSSHGDTAKVRIAMDRLFSRLEQLKSHCTDEDWRACVNGCRAHSLMKTVHEDPFTGRAFAKPRGYAGDAEMMDLIYGSEERWPDPQATPLGLDILRYTTSAPASEGVRARRGFIADLIDDVTSKRPGQHFLAIAAGHLREAILTTALRRRRIGRFVALDADPVSLKEVDHAYGSYGVETLCASFGKLITNRLDAGTFDVVYSTGLFDYLNEKIGRRLVTTMFEMLNPGGQLVVANFLPKIRDIGYMEAFMDWNLIYRTRQDMINLTMEIDESEIGRIELFTEENRNIIFLRVWKK